MLFSYFGKVSIVYLLIGSRIAENKNNDEGESKQPHLNLASDLDHRKRTQLWRRALKSQRVTIGGASSNSLLSAWHPDQPPKHLPFIIRFYFLSSSSFSISLLILSISLAFSFSPNFLFSLFSVYLSHSFSPLSTYSSLSIFLVLSLLTLLFSFLIFFVLSLLSFLSIHLCAFVSSNCRIH